MGVTSSDDPHALEKLDKDDEHTALHLLLCDHLIVSDILNPDGIISNDEQIAALLNEPDDALQGALALFPSERTSEMVEEANFVGKNRGGRAQPAGSLAKTGANGKLVVG